MLLPLIALATLVFSVILRRSLGLLSGVYDVLLGLTMALLQYSALGIPGSLAKFLPEISATSGSAEVRRFLLRASFVRFVLLGLTLVPVNLFADPLATQLELGALGTTYVRFVSVLVIARGVIDIATQTLNAFFAHMWSNLLALVQGVLNSVLLLVALYFGYALAGVFGALVGGATLVALASVSCAMWQLRRLDPQAVARTTSEVGPALEPDSLVPRFLRFTCFTYIFQLSLFFSGMGFAALALALVLTPEDVALFAIAFRLTTMTAGLVVAGFRGLYLPLFARVRMRNDVRQLQRTYEVVSKAQLLLLLPAGIGLIVMSGDYIPLLFGAEFLPAVPIAWVLVGFMYAETAFNLPRIILSVDEKYREVFTAQALLVLAAPVFLMTAAGNSLPAAAVVFGGARLLTALVCYRFCRHAYGLQFPWSYTGRLFAISLIMGGVLAAARMVWVTSILEALALTFVGAVVFCVGARRAKVLSAEEADLLNRTELPGRTRILAWLAPHLAARGGGR